MNILITGGTGFIGSVLARYCLANGDDVTVLGLANNPVENERASELSREGIKVVLGSVLDTPLLQKIAQDVEVVVHLAAAQHESDKPDDYFRTINVDGTRSVVEACVNAGVPRLIHGSTIGVYGDAKGLVLSEASEPRPSNIYGETKYEAEKIVNAYRERIAATIFRISETYGPGDMRLLKLFSGVKKGWFPLIGSGGNRHQPICVDDLVVAVRKSVDCEKSIGETINLAGPVPVTTSDMIDAAALALGTRVHKLHIPMAPLSVLAVTLERTFPMVGLSPPLTRRRLDFFSKSFQFSVDKSQQLIGFVPSVSFIEGARRCAEWYTTHGLL